MAIDLLLVNGATQLSAWETELGSHLPPLGLASIAAYVRHKGYSVNICDAQNHALDLSAVCQQVAQDAPRVVGLTATTNAIESVAECARAIKEMHPAVTIIIGGPHVSALPEETLSRYAVFDAGVIGEGEITTHALLETDDWSHVEGLVVRQGTNVVRTPARPAIQDLNQLPFPAYDLLEGFPHAYRPTPNNYQVLPVAPVVASRGCPFGCRFCSQAVFGTGVRAFSSTYLLDLISYLQEHFGVREICFYDDIFLLDRNLLEEFCSGLHERAIHIQWSVEGRIGQFDAQQLAAMRAAGCWQISFGVESGSQEVLHYFNKQITVSDIAETVAAVRRVGIRARGYFIVGASAETRDTLNETERLIERLAWDDIHVAFFTPMPGSACYVEYASCTGEIDYRGLDQYSQRSYSPLLTDHELSRFVNRLYRRFYLHPVRLWRYVRMFFNYQKTGHLFRSFFGFMRFTCCGKETRSDRC